MAAQGHSYGGRWVEVAMALAIGLRILLACVYEPLYGNDAPSYAALANMIHTGDFTAYDGVRTPGYPLFMLLAGMDNRVIRLLQNIAGVLSILAAFALVRRLLPGVMTVAVIWLLSISIQFPFYEAIIQTEALAGLAVMASLYFFVRKIGNRHLNLMISATIASIGALIRPHLVVMPPLFFMLCFVAQRKNLRAAWPALISIAWPACILIGGWIGFNFLMIGRPVFTTLPKADIIAHMIPHIDDADPRFGPVKLAFVEAYEVLRERVESADDNRAFYTAYASDRLKQMGILPTLEVRDAIHEMAVDLIKKHPGQYAKSVIWAWGRFWRVHIIIYEECFGARNRWFSWAMKIWYPVKVAWLAVTGIFLLCLPCLLFIPMTPERRHLAYTSALILLAASFSQALTQYYDSARFAVPFLPLMVITAALVITSIMENWTRMRHTEPLTDREISRLGD